MSNSKICRTCNKDLPLEDFHKNKRKCYKDGRNSQCKFCCRKKEKDHIKKYKPVKRKKCSECKVIKPASEFHKNGGKRTGLCEDCKDCRNVKVVEKRYNLQKGQLELMKKEVNYKCEICNNELPLAVDHCHSTERVRGLLCSNCNTGLGQFKDNIKLLKHAIKYLEEK